MDTQQVKEEVVYTFKKGAGETFTIRHRTESWAVFFINQDGDLFIESDWGYWTFSWRAFGGGFKQFLTQLEPEYFFDKLLFNHNQWGKGRNKVHARAEKAIKTLFECFKKVLEKDIADTAPTMPPPPEGWHEGAMKHEKRQQPKDEPKQRI